MPANKSELKKLPVEFVSIDVPIPYERNNRKHDKKQIELIANSICEFGFNQPIVIDESNIILVGHGRLLAAQRLELESVPVVKLTTLTDTQKKAYRILDNKLQNDSEWDFDNLTVELDNLKEMDFDLDAWGLNELRVESEEEPEVYDDEFNPDLEQECFIKLGDLIELGEHRLWCSDFHEISDIGLQASLWITDPPYGVSYVGKTKRKLTIANDSLKEIGIEELWSDVTDMALSNLKSGGACIASVPPGPMNIIFAKKWTDLDILHQQLVWVKDSMVLGHSDYHYQHEPILYGWKPNGPHYFINDRTKTTILEYARPKASREHPTMKPLLLWCELIQNSSKAGDVCLDTFLGSGTTLIAADQLNRICYGMEIEPKYCQVIIDRYQRHCEKVGKPFVCKINGEPYQPIKEAA